MKKEVFVLVLMLLIICTGFSVSAKHVDKEILDKVALQESKKLTSGLSVAEKVGDEEQVAVIVKIKDSAKNNKRMLKSNLNFKTKYDYSNFNAFAGDIPVSNLKKLVDDNSVEGVYLDREFNISLNDANRIQNATLVWPKLVVNGNLTGKGLSACVLDTGVNYTHENLGSLNCGSGSFSNGNCGRVIAGYDFVNSDSDPYDDNGHGTHVTGIIASNASGYTGIAPEANIVSIKVCDNVGGCSGANILSGLDWCISNKSLFNISVISVSIGGGLSSSYCDGSSSFTSLINSAVGNNISVVVASGNGLNNDGSGKSTQIAEPACVENATAISAVDKSDNIASYSNRWALKDIFTIGSSITSTSITGDSEVKSGTSMAAPMFSGAVLLLQQYKVFEGNRELTVYEVNDALNDTGVVILDSATGLNYSRISIYDALISVDNNSPVLSLASPENKSYNFNTSISLNYSASDALLDSVFYSLDGSANTSLAGNITVNVSSGAHTIIIYANDSAGNLNSSSVSFDVDLVEPYVAFVNPSVGNYSNNILINITNNSDAKNIWFFNGTGNQSYSFGSAGVLINLSNGGYNLIAYANDSAGNLNSSSVGISVDLIEPTIIVNSPVSGGYFNSDFILNISLSDSGIGLNYSTVFYRWENASQNSSWAMMSNTSLSLFNATFDVDVLGDGNYSLRFNVSDLLNNTNTSVVSDFSLDRIFPYIAVNLSSSVSSSGVVITFNSSELSNLSLNYGTNLGVLGSTSNDNSFVVNHTVSISGLSSSTLYYYNISFCDNANNCNSTGSFNFTTSAAAVIQNAGGGGGGGGGSGSSSSSGGLSQSWNLMAKGEVYTFATEKADYPVKKIEITPKNDLTKVKVIIKKLEDKPDNILKAPGILNSYFEVSKENIANSEIKKALLGFSVDKNWVLKQGSKDNVALLRYNGVDKNWETLETRFVSEADGQFIYEAVTPGFSYFAIVYVGNAETNSNKIVGNEKEDVLSGNAVADSLFNNKTEGDQETDALNTIGGESSLWVISLIAIIFIIIAAYYFSNAAVKE